MRVLRVRASLKLDVIVADPTACDDIDDLIVAAELERVLLRQYAPVTVTCDPCASPQRFALTVRGFLSEVGQAETWLP